MKNIPLSHKKQSPFKILNVNSTLEIQPQHILESNLPTKNKHKIINLNPEKLQALNNKHQNASKAQESKPCAMDEVLSAET